MEPWPGGIITSYVTVTEDRIVSPRLFRLWGAIALVAGALERRVTFTTSSGPIWPNLYTLLVAPPGVGKKVIDDIGGLWRETMEPGTRSPKFKVAPHNMTKASLVDKLQEAKCQRITPGGVMVYHSLLVAAGEFPVLLPAYDLEYIGTLNYLWDNPGDYSESRRHGPQREVTIPHPQLNILAGVQPSWMTQVIPEEAWSTGLARRFIMVYASESPRFDIFSSKPPEPAIRQMLVGQLAKASNLFGECVFSAPAIERIREWHLAGGPPSPTHSKLQHYNQSRTVLALKLAMISTVSRTGTLRGELIDMERALAWLFEIEALMPDIFRAMVGKSDSQVIDELHYAMTLMMAKAKGQGSIDKSALVKFLTARVPSEKIERIIQTAENAHIIVRMAGEERYRPLPKHQTGME